MILQPAENGRVVVWFFPGNGLSTYITIFKMTHSGIIYFPLDVQSRAG